MSVMDHWPVVGLTDDRLAELGRMVRQMQKDAEAAIGIQIDEEENGELALSHRPDTTADADVSWAELGRLATVQRLGTIMAEVLAAMGDTLDAVRQRNLPKLLACESVLHDRLGYAGPALQDAEAEGVNVSWGPAVETIAHARMLQRSVQLVRVLTPDDTPPKDTRAERDQDELKENLAGQDKEESTDIAPPGDYPTPENYKRDKWIYEQRKSGKILADIVSELTKHPEWMGLDSDNGIREAVMRYATYHSLPIPRVKPGPRAKG